MKIFRGPLLFRSYQPINSESKLKIVTSGDKIEHFEAVDNLIKDQIEDTYDTSIKETLVY